MVATNGSPLISIIIPAYNSAKTIGKLLGSIADSAGFNECEVIVVDDASSDATLEVTAGYNVKLIKNRINSGSAASRNKGVKEANGNTIIFFDADVVLCAGALSGLITKFKGMPGGSALLGVYSKDSATKGFVAEFKALLDYYHWVSADTDRVDFFEPRCAIIDKGVFEAAGGFDENIKWGVEDYEFGYRLIANKGTIYVDKTIQVIHHFPATVFTLIKNFFQRGSAWVQIFLEKREFDNVATTAAAALSCGFAFLSVFFLAGLPFAKIFVYLFAISAFLYYYFFRNFFKFVFYEKGSLFFLKAVLLQYLLSLVLGFAAIKGLFYYLNNRIYELFKINADKN